MAPASYQSQPQNRLSRILVLSAERSPCPRREESALAHGVVDRLSSPPLCGETGSHRVQPESARRRGIRCDMSPALPMHSLSLSLSISPSPAPLPLLCVFSELH